MQNCVEGGVSCLMMIESIFTLLKSMLLLPLHFAHQSNSPAFCSGIMTTFFLRAIDSYTGPAAVDSWNSCTQDCVLFCILVSYFSHLIVLLWRQQALLTSPSKFQNRVRDLVLRPAGNHCWVIAIKSLLRLICIHCGWNSTDKISTMGQNYVTLQ